ncbi:hypothetical protein QTP86_006534 [Hemibagrus guttatus]|nr:hypothetical protein QTP86_006534 [Hemibagrus guttatus]
MPEEWRRSVLVPIFKNKGDVQSCSNYRGIKLMSHTMKLWERVVEARLRKVVEICEQQYGFMPRKSTTDAIFALRILMEKYRDGQRELHCVFVDLEKAYDRVPREELWYCMRKSGVAEKYVRVVQDMYERSRTVVRCAVGQTEEFNVEVGLHQGSALSPFLFAIVMDQLSEEVRQESPWTMMFADDIVICSESREQVEENLERWRFALERRGMKVSGSKTEYMCVNEREGSGTVRLQGEEVKKVQEFKYLGSTVQSNGECGKEVKKRVQAGWNGWRKVWGVLCDRKISARIKGKVYRTVVRAAMLYGLETVSLRKRQESELEVAELKMLRFSLGVTRLDRIRNEYIRGTAHVGRLGDKVRETRLRWFGHVQRREKLEDEPLDHEEQDAGELDHEELDSGELDAGELDSGELDAGELDSGELDRGCGMLLFSLLDNHLLIGTRHIAAAFLSVTSSPRGDGEPAAGIVLSAPLPRLHLDGGCVLTRFSLTSFLLNTLSITLDDGGEDDGGDDDGGEDDGGEDDGGDDDGGDDDGGDDDGGDDDGGEDDGGDDDGGDDDGGEDDGGDDDGGDDDGGDDDGGEDDGGEDDGGDDDGGDDDGDEDDGGDDDGGDDDGGDDDGGEDDGGEDDGGDDDGGDDDGGDDDGGEDDGGDDDGGDDDGGEDDGGEDDGGDDDGGDDDGGEMMVVMMMVVMMMVVRMMVVRMMVVMMMVVMMMVVMMMVIRFISTKFTMSLSAAVSSFPSVELQTLFQHDNVPVHKAPELHEDMVWRSLSKNLQVLNFATKYQPYTEQVSVDKHHLDPLLQKLNKPAEILSFLFLCYYGNPRLLEEPETRWCLGSSGT